MDIIFSFLVLGLTIFGCMKLYNKVMKTGKRVASYATDRGRNRAALIGELYNFVQLHGGVNYVYVGRKSCMLYDMKGNRFEYTYRDHGYGEIPVHDGVIDVGERLAGRLKCHTVNDFVKVEDRGGLGQEVSFAVGNYGTTGGGGYVAGVYLLNDQQYAMWREKVKKNTPPPVKRV